LHRKGIYQDLAKWADSRGFDQLRVDGEFVATKPFPKLDRYKEHTIELPIGQIQVSASQEAALRQLVEQALEYGQGSLSLLTQDAKGQAVSQLLSTKRACPSCGTSLPEPEPRLFSYNTKLGWCPSCTGTGLFTASLAEDETGEEDRFLVTESELEDQDTPLECPSCDGARLNPIARGILLHDMGIHQVSRLSVESLNWVLTCKGFVTSWMSRLSACTLRITKPCWGCCADSKKKATPWSSSSMMKRPSPWPIT